MFKNFYPYEYAESVFVIDYVKLFSKGYRGIIFDIDMTLVPHGYDANEKVEELFRTIHATGIKTLLLTNNDEKRVKSFIKNIDTPYICDANKPERAGYLQALKILGITKEQAIYIGDQIFIDIYGVNRWGIANILVKYVTAHVEKNIGIRRNLEKIILKLYSISNYRNRLGDIFLTEDL